MQTATVVGPKGEEIYTDDYARVKVHFHWDRRPPDENSSCWIRVMQPIAGPGFGHIWIPRVGQEVVVQFLEGDPDRPVITGCLYNHVNHPPYTPVPKFKDWSGIKTRSTKKGKPTEFNELRFVDTKGSELYVMHAQKDMQITVENDTIELVDRDRTLQVKRNQTEMVEGDKHNTVKGNFNEDIQGEMSINVQKNVNEKAAGNFLLEAGGEVHIKAGARIVLEAPNITFIGNGSFIDCSALGISIQGPNVFLNCGLGLPTGAFGAMPQLPNIPSLPAGFNMSMLANMPNLPTMVSSLTSVAAGGLGGALGSALGGGAGGLGGALGSALGGGGGGLGGALGDTLGGGGSGLGGALGSALASNPFVAPGTFSGELGASGGQIPDLGSIVEGPIPGLPSGMMSGMPQTPTGVSGMSQDPTDSGNLQADEQQYSESQPGPSGPISGPDGGGGEGLG
jgi:type VI secretion system secreted protein VgrG